MTKKTDAPVAHLKKSARALQRFLAAQGLTLSLGRSLDALAVLQGHADWNSLSAAARKAATAPAARTPRIRDVPLEYVSNLVLGGQPFSVRWREDALIARWRQGELSQEDAEGTEALQLGREEDGLVWDEQVTFDTLDTLLWSTEHKAFVGPEGETWRFFVESEFGVDRPPEAAKAVVQDATPLAVAQGKPRAPRAPRLYSVALYAVSGDSPSAFLGKRTFAAATEKAARRVAYEELWDDRLDEGDARPDYFVERLDDDEDGEFVVYIDDGEYDRFESFAAAWRVATFMFEETAESHVSIENGAGDAVFKLQK